MRDEISFGMIQTVQAGLQSFLDWGMMGRVRDVWGGDTGCEGEKRQGDLEVASVVAETGNGGHGADEDASREGSADSDGLTKTLGRLVGDDGGVTGVLLEGALGAEGLDANVGDAWRVAVDGRFTKGAYGEDRFGQGLEYGQFRGAKLVGRATCHENNSRRMQSIYAARAVAIWTFVIQWGRLDTWRSGVTVRDEM